MSIEIYQSFVELVNIIYLKKKNYHRFKLHCQRSKFRNLKTL